MPDENLTFCDPTGGVPRTPVRQKMKTMSRSLQMLNVARLNVKAQKFQPDGVPPAAGEKVPQKLLRRSDDKLEENRRVLKISIGTCQTGLLALVFVTGAEQSN